MPPSLAQLVSSKLRGWVHWRKFRLWFAFSGLLPLFSLTPRRRWVCSCAFHLATEVCFLESTTGSDLVLKNGSIADDVWHASLVCRNAGDRCVELGSESTNSCAFSFVHLIRRAGRKCEKPRQGHVWNAMVKATEAVNWSLRKVPRLPDVNDLISAADQVDAASPPCGSI